MPAPAAVDHLVYAAPSLAAGVDRLEGMLGVRATEGGRHPGRGTHNALIALGADAYLEVVAPDPGQPHPPGPRWFGVDRVREPRLVGWAARATDLEERVAAAARQGVTLGGVRAGSRLRADGVRLAWRFTDPETVVADGICPFFIDWQGSPHPAATAAPGVTMLGLRAEHPEAAVLRPLLDALGVALPVTPGPAPVLVAMLDTPRGRVELR